MMKTLQWLVVLFAVCALPLLAGPVSFIADPNAAYLARTAYIDPSYLSDGDPVNSITDGILTVMFSAPVTKLTHPDSWASWSSPPDSEGDIGPVLWSNGATSLSMVLSTPVRTFGFEAEPNEFSIHTMTATFYNESHTLLGSLVQDVDGSGGARLFGASADPIMFIDLSTDLDFAFGAIRYSGAVPEPATYLLLGSALAGFSFKLRRRS